MKKIGVYLVFLLCLVSVVSAQYYYTDKGFSLGGIDFLEIYNEYTYEIDFFIFLVIFLGLTKAVFKDRFKQQSNIISVGVSIALALAIVLWEKSTGKFILSYGAVIVTILIIAVIFAVIWIALKFIWRTIFPNKNKPS